MKAGIMRNYPTVFDTAMRLLDPLLVVVVTLLLGFHSSYLGPADLYKSFAIYGAILTVVCFPICGLYRSWRGSVLFREIKALFWGWAVVLILFNLLLLVLADYEQRRILWPYGLMQVSQFWVWAGACFAVLVLFRLGIRFTLRFLRKHGRNTRTAVILGAGDLGEQTLTTMQNNHWLGYRVLALFDDDRNRWGREINGVAIKGGLEQAPGFVNGQRVDEVFLALPLRNEARIREIVAMLNNTTANVYLVPDLFNFHILQLSLSELAGLPLINLNGTPLNDPWGRLVKLLEDLVLGLVILLLISPLMVVLGLLIKITSPGPVFFTQRRYGMKGEQITVYKFRTMTVCEDGAEVPQARRLDPRVTGIGTFLRRTSLDELPQFINVLQGKMSIVGPRPHAVAHNEQYRKIINSYMLRHKVKPGITGWAQVNGWRGETDTLAKMEKRVEYDLYYLTNWSLWLDLKIIFMTLWKGFVSKNAY